MYNPKKEKKESRKRAGQPLASAGVEHPLERILVAVANNQSESECEGASKSAYLCKVLFFISREKKEKGKRVRAYVQKANFSHMVEDWSVEQVSASTAIERGSVGFESTDNVQ